MPSFITVRLIYKRITYQNKCFDVFFDGYYRYISFKSEPVQISIHMEKKYPLAGTLILFIVIFLLISAESDNIVSDQNLQKKLIDIASSNDEISSYIDSNPESKTVIRLIGKDEADTFADRFPSIEEMKSTKDDRFYDIRIENGNRSSMRTVINWDNKSVYHYEIYVSDKTDETTDNETSSKKVMRCARGFLRCRNDNLEECPEDGSGFIVKEYCEYGCSVENLSCYSYEDIKVCENDTIACSSDGRSLQRCADDGLSWELFEECDHGCNKDISECMNCTPGKRQCSYKDLMECSSDGSSWEFVQECRHGCSGSSCLTANDTHAYRGCHDNDLYWFTGSGIPEDIVKECGYVCVTLDEGTDAYCVSDSDEMTCIDPDAGDDDIYTPGYVQVMVVVKGDTYLNMTDECESSSYLKEYVCGNDMASVTFRDVNCENGCNTTSSGIGYCIQ